MFWRSRAYQHVVHTPIKASSFLKKKQVATILLIVILEKITLARIEKSYLLITFYLVSEIDRLFFVRAVNFFATKETPFSRLTYWKINHHDFHRLTVWSVIFYQQSTIDNLILSLQVKEYNTISIFYLKKQTVPEEQRKLQKWHPNCEERLCSESTVDLHWFLQWKLR